MEALISKDPGGSSVKKLSKHDKYVKELCDLIKYQYDTIILGFKIRSAKRTFGEIDILARKGDNLDIYEVKCSHRPVKARRQLAKIRKYVKTQGKSYFYCGTTKVLMAMQI